MAESLPSNVHVSKHPCVRAKLSQLRSQGTNSKDTKSFVHDIATIVGSEALGHGLQVVETGMVSFNITPSWSEADEYTVLVWLI